MGSSPKGTWLLTHRALYAGSHGVSVGARLVQDGVGPLNSHTVESHDTYRDWMPFSRLARAHKVLRHEPMGTFRSCSGHEGRKGTLKRIRLFTAPNKSLA